MRRRYSPVPSPTAWATQAHRDHGLAHLCRSRGAAGFVRRLASFYTFLGVGGFAYGIYIAVDQALLAEVLPNADDRAKDMGILNIANTLPQVIAPVLAGVLVSVLGYQPVFIIAMALAVVSAIVLKPIRRVR